MHSQIGSLIVGSLATYAQACPELDCAGRSSIERLADARTEPDRNSSMSGGGWTQQRHLAVDQIVATVIARIPPEELFDRHSDGSGLGHDVILPPGRAPRQRGSAAEIGSAHV